MFWNKRKGREPEPERPVPMGQEPPAEDDLESITADLPRREPEDEENEGVTREASTERPVAASDPAEDADLPDDDEAGRWPIQRDATRRRREQAGSPPPDDLSDEGGSPSGRPSGHPRLLRVLRAAFTVLLLYLVISIILTQVLEAGTTLRRVVDTSEEAVSDAMTPIQGFFASITNAGIDYLRTLKRRANLDNAYNELLAENEQLAYRAMFADEYQIRLSQYEEIDSWVKANTGMSPIVCTVIGRDDGNYFSTFTINHGSRDGIEPYMAVVYGEALIGYTETVTETRATVRTIIDSGASIAALIQSSRDQGTIVGTLGTDGTAMCRMYYLPEDHLPRPGDQVVTSGVGMSFPRGIPVGTVRESTRNLDANKQYIVVEPKADFQHIEYVLVLRYQPDPLPVQDRASTEIQLQATETARPYPTIRYGSVNSWNTTGSGDTEETPAPSLTPAPTPSPTPSPTPRPATPVPGPTATPLEYVTVHTGPTPSPEPSPTPSPTPYVTLDPSNMILEDD